MKVSFLSAMLICFLSSTLYAAEPSTANLQQEIDQLQKMINQAQEQTLAQLKALQQQVSTNTNTQIDQLQKQIQQIQKENADNLTLIQGQIKQSHDVLQKEMDTLHAELQELVKNKGH